MNEERETSVREVWQSIDAGTGALRLASGLACPAGCGRCCLAPEVYASELELRPLARALWTRGEGQAWLARLAERADDPRCAVYEPDPEDPTRGRCAHYELRPSVCRLFGFASRRGRDGRPALAACRVHRETAPEAVAAAERAIAAGVPAPELSSAASALGALGADAEAVPINEALRRALTAAGLAWLLAGAETRDESPEPPVRPPRRRRRRAA